MNTFKWIYEWLFVNKSIQEQDDMRLDDLAVLKYYRKQLNASIK
jgi:hypothetical protein